jgi:hypothetical protein
MEIMKIGDKVRFLSEVGGGVVTGFRGNSYENDKFLSFLCIFFIHLEPILDTIISIVTKK